MGTQMTNKRFLTPSSTMQRRNINLNSSPSSGDRESTGGLAPMRTPSRTSSFKGHEPASTTTRIPTPLLVAVAVLITILTYLTPTELSDYEHEVAMQASSMAHKAYEKEQEMMQWWQQERHNKPPLIVGHDGDQASKLSATERMKQQPSQWVDGEKKLKQKLKVLAERQAKGEDMGVPILTRYLGEDIPAWAGKDVNVEEWNKAVAAKYAEMRKEEEEWQKRVEKALKEQRG